MILGRGFTGAVVCTAVSVNNIWLWVDTLDKDNLWYLSLSFN